MKKAFAKARRVKHPLILLATALIAVAIYRHSCEKMQRKDSGGKINIAADGIST